MRKGRPKYPQPRDVTPVMRALQLHIPMDTPLMYGMRESLRHVPNFRIKAATNEIVWVVDVYKGHFYHVAVGDSTEVHTTIPALINHLWRGLGIKKL
jgi:hypothetical protein